MNKRTSLDDNHYLYCICPSCKAVRRKVDHKFTIIKRGRERNGVARFFCLNCTSWFNENTGNVMKWLDR